VVVVPEGDTGRPPWERSAGLLKWGSMTEPVVRVDAVVRTFEAELAPVRALRGATLEVGRGEFVAITGPSGCGKSTLLNIVAGLDLPDGGSVEVAGVALDGLDENARSTLRRAHVGIVFQFFNLFETMTVLENVMMPALLVGTKRRAADTRARGLLDVLGIGDKCGQPPAALSGGQRQRLAIARALANEPTLLLADEPTGSLDSDGGHEILQLFRGLHAEGQTIVLVTHDRVVADAAERVVRMRDGRVVDDGTPARGPAPAATTVAK
jgi:putative ABC transport system ATP-binding protein